MDPHFFDDLTRLIAGGTTRRTALLTALTPLTSVFGASAARRRCLGAGKRCTRGRQCCSRRCTKRGRCLTVPVTLQCPSKETPYWCDGLQSCQECCWDTDCRPNGAICIGETELTCCVKEHEPCGSDGIDCCESLDATTAITCGGTPKRCCRDGGSVCNVDSDECCSGTCVLGPNAGLGTCQ